MRIDIFTGESNINLNFSESLKLSDIIIKNNIWLDMPCAGRGVCGKCRVRAFGALSPVSGRERELLTQEEIATGARLACVTYAVGDVKIEMLPAEQSQQIQLDSDVFAANAMLNPLGTGLGIALDIGTTTLVFYLLDLTSGDVLNTYAAVNPQNIFGADVVSRIENALDGGSRELADSIRNCINDGAAALCENYAVSDVSAFVVTGNTAMLYFLTERSPESIATAPFIPNSYFGEMLTGGDIGLENFADAVVYLPRCISAYVGADITVGAVACGYLDDGDCRRNTSLFVDIGTNGEMILANDGKFYACSTAAGPALEGVGVSFGMPARPGAISKIYVQDGKICFETVGGENPIGICGSGIVDLVAAMLEIGVIDTTGYILDSGHDFEGWVTEVDEQRIFQLPGTEIRVLQSDIRAVQYSKAAICAGIKTLAKFAGCGLGDIDEVLIAGGFGSFLDARCAEKIGLLPHGFAKKSRIMGNTAVAGAAMLLKNTDYIAKSEKFAKNVEVVELATNDDFMNIYICEMMF